jgi:hypothetical protein
MSDDTDSEEDNRKRKAEYDRTLTVVTAVTSAVSAAAFGMDAIDESSDEKSAVDHRQLPRGERRVFRHDQALMCINRDYLGPKALFPGKKFITWFCISPERFHRLMNDVVNSGIPYYNNRVDATGEEGSSLEARLMLPLKTLA